MDCPNSRRKQRPEWTAAEALTRGSRIICSGERSATGIPRHKTPSCSEIGAHQKFRGGAVPEFRSLWALPRCAADPLPRTGPSARWLPEKIFSAGDPDLSGGEGGLVPCKLPEPEPRSLVLFIGVHSSIARVRPQIEGTDLQHRASFKEVAPRTSVPRRSCRFSTAALPPALRDFLVKEQHPCHPSI